MMFKAALVALALCVGAATWQYNRANDLAAALATAEERRQAEARDFRRLEAALRASIERLEDQRRIDQANMDFLAEQNNRIAKERDDEKAKLDGYRNRLQRAALARPGLVGRAATRAVGRLFAEFGRATDPGGDPDEADPAVPPAAAAAGEPAGRDRSGSADPGNDARVE